MVDCRDSGVAPVGAPSKNLGPTVQHPILGQMCRQSVSQSAERCRPSHGTEAHSLLHLRRDPVGQPDERHPSGSHVERRQRELTRLSKHSVAGPASQGTSTAVAGGGLWLSPLVVKPNVTSLISGILLTQTAAPCASGSLFRTAMDGSGHAADNPTLYIYLAQRQS